ncbi:DUF2089 domain-containing protein [Clostridium sp. B9]|uniref:DUF2089 domain-containing protein n=1 Tax=Clostridium sp. B9 TaxID=3423224 RepID=UPI003D2F2653
MKYVRPSKCPVCNSELKIVKLECEKCNTKIEGDFRGCDFCNLTQEEQYFLKIFVKCKGSIKEIEKELDISYPTVKSRLNQLITALGFEDKETEEEKLDKKKSRALILEKLDRGEISSTEALKELEKFK